MNICFVTSGSEDVGTYFRAFFWAQHFVDRGHSVTLLSSHKKADWTPVRTKLRNGVRILTYLKSPLRFDYAGFLLRPVFVFFHVLFGRYDVVHSFVSWQPPSAAALLSVKILKVFGSSVRIFADWDDLWGTENGIAREHGVAVSRIATVLEKLVPRLADHVTVASRYLYDYAVSSGISRQKLTVIFNGSNIRDIKPMGKIRARKLLNFPLRIHIVLYIGQFHTHVFEKLLKAVSAATGKFPDFKCLIVGPIPESGIAGNSGVVQYTGSVAYDAIPAYLSAADLLLLPMDTTPVEEARFPIRFGDYLASGTPILASPTGEIRRLVQENDIAYISDIADTKQFSKDMIRLLKSNKTGRMGKRARFWAEHHFSWEIIAEKLGALYEQ